MALNFLGSARISAAAITVSTLVAACGGGGGGESDASSSATEVTSGASTATTTSATTGNQDALTATANTSADTTSSAEGATASVESVSSAATSTTLASTSLSGSTSGLVSVGSGDTGLTSGTQTVVATATNTGATSTGSAVLGKRSSVALNVSALSYYSPELPTIDVMKRAGGWLTQCSTTCGTLPSGASSWDTREEAALDLDANGWVKSLPAAGDTTHKYRSVATMLSASGALPVGRYIVRYDGSGTIAYSGFTKSSTSTAGRDVVDLTTTGNAWMVITATDSTNYLRNIRVYPPGGACANDYTTYAASAAACNATTGAYVPFESFPADQIWHPSFLTDIKGFRALRFMDWNLTNTTNAAVWTDRTQPGARIWTVATGVPYEAEMDLATKIGADAWINVPPMVDDNYAAQMGVLAATHISGVSKLDLEYANEPWNYGFTVATWMLNQAKAKWPAQVAKGTSPYTLQDDWYGLRAAQVCRAAKTGSSAILCVLNAQAANSAIANEMLSCPYASAELGHICAKDINVVAIAPYFGGYITAANLRSTIATWYSDADGGLSKLFSEITGLDASGNVITPPLLAAGSNIQGGALPQAKRWMVANKAVADTYGLPMWAYEGGQHLVLPGGDTDANMQALLVAANRDPRMGAAYDRMMSDWKASGGQAFAYYSHIGQPSVYGIWGLKETMTDNANVKWVSALANRNAKNCSWTGC